MQERSISTAILLRGYAAHGGISDEAEIYRRAFGQAAVFTGANRKLNLEKAKHAGFSACILDDAFQHLSVYRDLDLVLIDATRLPLDGYLLPAGMMRESESSLRRAHGVIFTRCNQAVAAVLQNTIAMVQKRYPHLNLYQSSLSDCSISYLDQAFDTRSNVLACCALGNPDSFLASLKEEFGDAVVAWEFFPDHHFFTPENLLALEAKARTHHAQWIAISSKDACKWPAGGQMPVGILDVHPQITPVGDAPPLEDYVSDIITHWPEKSPGINS